MGKESVTKELRTKYFRTDDELCDFVKLREIQEEDVQFIGRAYIGLFQLTWWSVNRSL